jgi:NAD(P)-dependent dehydrogenase (short-subunit alcohol dehydrogenase family)
MDLKLKDRVAIVTGTGSHIGFGKGIALTLAKEGCNIVSVDLDLEGAKKQRLTGGKIFKSSGIVFVGFYWNGSGF